jgi:hypothetical protein
MPSVIPGGPQDREGQLCWFGSWHEGFLVSDDGVEDGEDFAGESDEGELGRLSGLPEGFVDSGKGRARAGCGQGGHVERIAHALPPAADLSLPTFASAVVVEGR